MGEAALQTMKLIFALVVLCLLSVVSAGYNRGAAAKQAHSLCGSSTGNSGCSGSKFGCCTDLVIKSLAAGGVKVSSRMAVTLGNDLKKWGGKQTQVASNPAS